MNSIANANSIKARLVITSVEVLPDAISEYLGISPTKTWLQGETVTPRATNIHKEHGWVLSVDGERGEVFAVKLIDRLLSQVPADRLAELCKQHPGSIQVELSVIVYISPSETIPSIALSSAQLQLLAACAGTFDVDMYCR